jgi:hypothetical protein
VTRYSNFNKILKPKLILDVFISNRFEIINLNKSSNADSFDEKNYGKIKANNFVRIWLHNFWIFKLNISRTIPTRIK